MGPSVPPTHPPHRSPSLLSLSLSPIFFLARFVDVYSSIKVLEMNSRSVAAAVVVKCENLLKNCSSSSQACKTLTSAVGCDLDAVVRSACVAATSSIASHITKPPVAKPLVDMLVNSQIGTAFCLAAVINGAPDPDTAYLRKLLPRIERLLKNDCFKAKAALLTVVASAINVGAASSPARNGRERYEG